MKLKNTGFEVELNTEGCFLRFYGAAIITSPIRNGPNETRDFIEQVICAVYERALTSGRVSGRESMMPGIHKLIDDLHLQRELHQNAIKIIGDLRRRNKKC